MFKTIKFSSLALLVAALFFIQAQPAQALGIKEVAVEKQRGSSGNYRAYIYFFNHGKKVQTCSIAGFKVKSKLYRAQPSLSICGIGHTFSKSYSQRRKAKGIFRSRALKILVRHSGKVRFLRISRRVYG